MKLSQMPDLCEARDKIARRLQEKRGLEVMDSLGEANTIVLRAFAEERAAARGRPVSEVASRAAERAVKEQRGKKQALAAGPGGQQDAAMIREVVRQAVARVVAESMNGGPAPGGAPPAAPAPANRRLLREFTDDELFDQVGEVLGAHASYVASAVRETETAADPESFPVLAPEELRRLGNNDFAQYLGAALDAGAAARVPSPFLAGFGDG